MELLLKRIARKETYTIGHLYLNGEYFCDTLEDKDRGLDNDKMSIAEIKAIKVPRETAIPTGKYEVSITYSPRFKRMMPLLSGVKGFSGVRIHTGNYAGFETFLKTIPIDKNKKILNRSEYIRVVD